MTDSASPHSAPAVVAAPPIGGVPPGGPPPIAPFVKMHAHAVGAGTPQLDKPKFRAPGAATWAYLEAGLRARLAECGALPAGAPLFVLVRGFAPLAEQRLADLFDAFATDGELVVQYSTAPAFA